MARSAAEPERRTPNNGSGKAASSENPPCAGLDTLGAFPGFCVFDGRNRVNVRAVLFRRHLWSDFISEMCLVRAPQTLPEVAFGYS
jgi:hypothetical protein